MNIENKKSLKGLILFIVIATACFGTITSASDLGGKKVTECTIGYPENC